MNALQLMTAVVLIVRNQTAPVKCFEDLVLSASVHMCRGLTGEEIGTLFHAWMHLTARDQNFKD